MVRLVRSAGVPFLVVHLRAAIGAIQNAGQRVRLAADTLPDALRFPQPLNDIPCFLVYDGGVHVFEYGPVLWCRLFPPFGFIAFLCGLVQNFPAHVFLFFEDLNNGGDRPLGGIWVVRLLHARADFLPMCGGGVYALGGQFVRDLRHAHALDNASVDTAHDCRRFFVYEPFLTVIWVMDISIGYRAGNVLPSRRPRAEYGSYLAAGISGVPLREDVAERHKIVLSLGGVDTLGNGNQPNALFA